MSVETIKLGDALNLYNGKAPVLSEKGEVTVFGSNGVIGKSEKANHPRSIILGRVGAYCGAVKFSDEPFWASDNTIVVRPVEGHDLKYWYYKLQSIPLRGYAGGAAQPLITHSIIKPLETQVHDDVVEQQRIASVLSAYDDLIENNRRRIVLLEEAARLLYREWFVHFRFPGHEQKKIIDGVPEGWEIVSMEEVCARITDGSHSSPKSVDEGYPMASVKDMHDWGIDTKNCRHIGHDDYEKLVRADCKPLKNDVLIAKDGSYLKHCFVVQEEIDLVILSSIAILRPNKRIDPHLLNFILRDPQTKEKMKGYVSGAALPRIILKEFRNFKVLLPDEETQFLWADYVHPIAGQCASLIKQSEQLVKARDLLLPRLMDGRIEV